MLDHARPYEHNMCDVYLPPSPAPPAPLDNFHIFKKGSNSYVYGDYYSTGYELYGEPDAPAAAVYHDLLNSRECQRDYTYKSIIEWTPEDTMSWIFDTAKHSGFLECDIPFYNFKVSGNELRVMRSDEMQQRMAHPTVDPYLSRRIADTLFEKLQNRVTEEVHRQPVYRYPSEFPVASQTEQTDMLDLDSLEHKARLMAACRGEAPVRDTPLGGDSSDEDPYRHSETASPDCSYSSDVSKSGDEEDKRKLFKRPPGRPKGSGRKVCKRPRSVSVPEFLRNLLLDPKYCPAIIKWEDHAQGKFRFVKPDEVAKLWGKMKQNDNMTFEKFSRAMRYHYRQSVLVSVPTARLVYQFGHKGPDINTDNPNFVKVKSELDIRDLYP